MLFQFIDKPCEDSLTAAVFTHLLHLPSEIFWQILKRACHTDSLPQYAGEPSCKVEFWPKWNAEHTRNSRYVEPDIFIRFPNFDLIIEAKRYDDFQQDLRQWTDEVVAYNNEYGVENVPVRLIAVGGIWRAEDDLVTHKNISCRVHMCRWGSLLEECQRMYRELEHIKYLSSATHANHRILADVISFFELHGFQTGIWLSELVATGKIIRLSSACGSHHRVFH